LNSGATPLDVLSRYWGYSEFRPQQAEIIQSVLSGTDTLGLLPTGGGKSITFQVPAMILPGLTLVVTPLISLMKDQVDNLRALDIPAAYLHSGLTRAEHKLALDKADAGKIKLLYLSPEKLQSERFLQSLKYLDISLIVVDEAHCISQWGYDFRPSYLKIAELRRLFPQVTVMALTASATPQVVEDIMTRLEFRTRTALFRRSFARHNLYYIVRYGENKPERLLRVMRNTAGSAIVYVRSRKRTREIAQLLVEAGISADFYHAGLAPEDKDNKQQLWKADRVRVMVATNAFGMGIDKPDVRVVVHYDLPSSVEEYYQEAGRGGRDGLPSFAVTLASRHDKATLSRRLADAFPPKDYVAEIYERACLFVDLSLGEGFNQVFDFDFDKFCLTQKLSVAPTRSALNLLTRAGYLEFVEDVNATARVMIIATKQELYNLQLQPDEDEVLQYLLRTYSGLFADYVQISEPSIAMRLQMSSEAVYHALLGLNRAHALHYIPRRQQPYLYFPSRRVKAKYVELPREVYEEQRARMEQRIEAMRSFTFDDEECRANSILRYFGEEPTAPCGTCDVCRARRAAAQAAPTAADTLSLRQRIIYVCSHAGATGISLTNLATELGMNSARIVEEVRAMVDDEKLDLDPITQNVISR
jgi:ATP-dependent DNA helicase RecQ